MFGESWDKLCVTFHFGLGAQLFQDPGPAARGPTIGAKTEGGRNPKEKRGISVDCATCSTEGVAER